MSAAMSDSATHPAVDLAIIGGGPTGLFAAFYAGLRQMSVKIIDSLETLGGQLVTLYPEKYIYDVAGFPRVLAKDLAVNLIEQASQYRPVVCLGEMVAALDFDPATHSLSDPKPSAARVATTAAAYLLVAAGAIGYLAGWYYTLGWGLPTIVPRSLWLFISISLLASLAAAFVASYLAFRQHTGRLLASVASLVTALTLLVFALGVSSFPAIR